MIFTFNLVVILVKVILVAITNRCRNLSVSTKWMFLILTKSPLNIKMGWHLGFCFIYLSGFQSSSTYGFQGPWGLIIQEEDEWKEHEGKEHKGKEYGCSNGQDLGVGGIHHTMLIQHASVISWIVYPQIHMVNLYPLTPSTLECDIFRK